MREYERFSRSAGRASKAAKLAVGWNRTPFLNQQTRYDTEQEGEAMQIIFDEEETGSIMSIVVSQILDQIELSDEARATLQQWRTERKEGTTELADVTVTLNESLGTVLDEKTTRLIRRKGRYVSSRGRTGA